jgi:hypothetical protein
MSEKEWNSRLKYIVVDEKERTKIPVICDKKVCHGFVLHDDYWYVLNLMNNRILMEGQARNNDDAKRQVKRALIILGAYFVEEVRATKEAPIRMLTEEAIDDIISKKGE